MNSFSGFRVTHSDWVAKAHETAELTLQVDVPTGEKFRLSFDFDQEQLQRMVEAYHGRHIYGLS